MGNGLHVMPGHGFLSRTRFPVFSVLSAQRDMSRTIRIVPAGEDMLTPCFNDLIGPQPVWLHILHIDRLAASTYVRRKIVGCFIEVERR